MFLLCILIIRQIQAVPEHQLNMYNTNNYQNGHCLSSDYHFIEDYIGSTAHGVKDVVEIISYCFRLTEEENSMINVDFQNTIDSNFTFAELKQKNITSQMLLSWSSSIDIAEQYQIFLNNHSNSSSEKDKIFYNCTSSWFGPFCQFQFNYQMDKSFRDTILNIFASKRRKLGSFMKIACYKHLPFCKTLLSCLDWREICDGKKDCLDGSDEENCWQLEVNKCSGSEYRCHNGQCVPIEFLQDIPRKPDCMDRTDEAYTQYITCFLDPYFECEEHTCRPGGDEFSCSDGDCVTEGKICENGRNSFLPSTFCSNVTACSLKLDELVDYGWCLLFCSDNNCVQDNCSMIYEFRHFPLLFGHIRFIISRNETDSDETNPPNYVCYDEKLCPHFPSSKIQFNNWTCRHLSDFGLLHEDLYYFPVESIGSIKNQFRGCLMAVNETHYCNYSTMYQCENSSKCISKSRLVDGILDCPYNDDETFSESCSLYDIHQRFKCQNDNNEKCFAQLAVRNQRIDCKSGKDEDEIFEALMITRINFQRICNGIIDLLSISIDGTIENDETECDRWECNNTYTRCNGFWSCEDGSDEIHCSPSICPPYHHACVFANDTSKVSCLSITRTGDGNVDCIGGTDERTKHYINRDMPFLIRISYQFQCWNDTKIIPMSQLCNHRKDCRFHDDEDFCRASETFFMERCRDSKEFLTDVEIFFCTYHKEITLERELFFRLDNILAYPSNLLIADDTSIARSTQIETRISDIDRDVHLPSETAWWCNRGVPISLRMNDNTSTLSCLCPPSYYGHTCQYQNQRVSLTVQVRVSSDWRNIFVFLITLIDNERNIHSHDHISYLPARDCRNKYNIHLLYSTRPKKLSKIYSIQIDVFDQTIMNYRASWIFPLQFPFLPVHRLAVLLKLPFLNMIFAQKKCLLPCIHGQCFHYVNDQNSEFCLCEPGWSGVQCNIKSNCDCAPGAICVSDSICLCPLGRFGPRCHLFQSSCNSKSCLNGGQCVPFDVRYTDPDAMKSTCICPEGYLGDHCDHSQRQTQIDISFHSSISVPSSLLVHFIAVQDHKKKEHNRTSIAKKIHFDENSLTIYISTSFNIALAQIMSQYYLIILHEQKIIAARISTTIIPSHRCRSINELFNETFANQHLLKRIKYYHVPCKEELELVCFYDKVQICLCTLDRRVNCFTFDHNMTYDCETYNYCGDNGDCFQDLYMCATTSFCTCHMCYFGSRCQFSTRGSVLSLDIILGYHIRLKTEINQQRVIVKIATAFIAIILFIGSINSFLTFQTFRRKQTRNVGCGIYLFTSSIISMITVIVLTLKFAFFITSQIDSIKNRSFLYLQCAIMDFLLRCLISTNDWLSACVSIERAISVIQGATFNKIKSKKMAKWMTLIVFLFTGCTYIYDPFYRRLMDDEEDQRTWCLTQYSSSVQLFDSVLNIFHFSFPFATNCISALIIITIAARTRSNSQKAKSFNEHLREQLHHHKHLLISSLILIALAVPRLIISFLSGCMKSVQDSWFYLIGYFISFIPSILTFIVFILPSNMYMEQFKKMTERLYQR